MVKTLLFHKDIFMPAGTQDTVADIQSYLQEDNSYRYSKHLQEHLEGEKDKSHDYLKEAIEEAIDWIKYRPQEAFEVEVQGRDGYWMVTKYCVRVRTSNRQDIILVIRPGANVKDFSYDMSNNLIVTAYLNASTDSHRTLDASKYCSKEEWNKVRFDKK